MAAPRDRRAPASRRPGGQAARRDPEPVHRWRRAVWWTVQLMLYSVLLAVGAWVGLVTSATMQLDQLERRASVRQVPGAILARDGRTVLRRLRAPTSRTYIEPDELPRLVVDAVVAAEDRRFMEHGGIDPRGIARAALADARAGAVVQGGSTITQQLVKNTYVGPRRTLARKSREAVFAVALETRWSKRRILATYLNTAYFGNGHYGIADAASGYYGVPLRRLKPSQAALLGALLRAPEGNNPAVAPARARAGRNRVLDSMRELRMLDERTWKGARAAPMPNPARLLRRRGSRRELAPQFSDTVTGQLIERYGVRRALGAGMRVRTTIDPELQRAARDAVGVVDDLGLDAALVAIDASSGEVRAVANGGGASRSAFNVAFDGRRQPGSAFKPFMLAAAYAAGYAPQTPIQSAPFDEPYPGGRFRVTNGGGYAGRTTMERATWASDNTAYARLQYRLGIEPAIDVATAAGIRSRMDPVPALVLGALPQGTTPVELAHAYATFAAHGTRTSLVGSGGPRLISSVRLRSGETWRPVATRRLAIPRQVADLVTGTLQGVITAGTGTAAAIGRPAAGKTGTTEEYRDAWFVGYTPELVTAVWVGHAEGGVPMRTEHLGGPVTGGTIPASIWSDFMRVALERVPVSEFELEEPKYVTVTIDEQTGLLAGPWCAGAVEARFIEGKAPTQASRDCEERVRPVPDVSGLDVQAAIDLLAEEGFEMVRTEQVLVTEPLQHGTVVRQEPEPGAEVAREDTLTLLVGEDPFTDGRAPTPEESQPDAQQPTTPDEA